MKRSDLLGQRFERLLVVGSLGNDARQTVRRWLCQCDCGRTTAVTTGCLTSGNTRSCGCLAYDVLVERNQKQARAQAQSRSEALIGLRFSKLTVTAFAGSDGRSCFWLCRCDCGAQTTQNTHHLTSGNTRSCGCLRNGGHHHRRTRSKEWYAWRSMRRRCQNPKCPQYRNYGGRGIEVCERWEEFELFFADMGLAPTGQSLDRWPNNNGNYEPGNCRWATAVQQRRNTRINRVLTWNGESRPVSEWSEITGLSKYAISWRLRAGWSVQRCLSTAKRGTYVEVT